MAGISMAEYPATFFCLWALMEDKNIDAILLQAQLGLNTKRLSKMFSPAEIRAFREAEESNLSLLSQRVREYGKPVFLVKPAVEFAADPEIASFFRRQGIPVYPNPRRAARVVHHLAWYRRYLDAIRA
jgi:acyl-CoA synthetase (NDP forming)